MATPEPTRAFLVICRDAGENEFIGDLTWEEALSWLKNVRGSDPGADLAVRFSSLPLALQQGILEWVGIPRHHHLAG